MARRTVRRYLLAGGFLALVVNVALNAAAGSVIYGGLAAVPLSGDHGLAGDTIVGAFLIGFFTLLIVAPEARREVRAGRVVGGRKRALPGWFARRPFVSAVLGGLASAVVVGGATVAIVGALGVAPMSVHAFLVFKIAFAGVWGTLAAVLVGALAAAGEPQPPDDDRWWRGGDEPSLVYPFDYVDKGGVAVTSKAHGCSGTPTWQLVVRGALDPAAVRSALGDLLVRYPALTTRVQSLDAIPEYAKRFRYAGAPVDLDTVFEVVDLRGRAADLEPLICDVWNRHLDQFREPPFSLTMALTDTGCRLLFRQHHGIADGRAFIELLGDFALFIRARESGAAPTADQLAPIGRRSELEALGLSAPLRVWYGLAGFGSLIASVTRAIVRPLSVLVHNDSADYTGSNGAIRWVIEDGALERWQPARDKYGASLNSIFTGALFLASQRWHRELGRELGRVNVSLVMETRPRDGTFRSFANHLATLEAELRLDRELDAPTAIRSIHAQIKRQLARKRPQKRLVCERALVAGMPLDKLQSFVFAAKRPAFNLNFSNLIPLDFPVLAGTDWTVEEVLITTPVTPRNGIVLTVIRYNGRLCFNFNHAQSAATTEQTAHLARLFVDALADITGYRPVELPTAAPSAPE